MENNALSAEKTSGEVRQFCQSGSSTAIGGMKMRLLVKHMEQQGQ